MQTEAEVAKVKKANRNMRKRLVEEDKEERKERMKTLKNDKRFYKYVLNEQLKQHDEMILRQQAAKAKKSD